MTDEPIEQASETQPPAPQKWRTLRSRLLRFLIWALAACFAVFAFAHVYAVALKFIQAPVTLNMIGSQLTGNRLSRDAVPLRQISPHLVLAVIAAEDSRFCQHGGLDMQAIRDAMRHNEKGGKRRGGSTISQQTAKNVFFWNGGGYVRKAGEAWMTLAIETVWGKRRIMSQYLNVAEWGDGIYGAEAAAQKRFGKPAKDLTAHEAALLAAVLPSPNKWRVDPPGPYTASRATTIRQRMSIVERDGLATCVLTKSASR